MSKPEHIWKWKEDVLITLRGQANWDVFTIIARGIGNISIIVHIQLIMCLSVKTPDIIRGQFCYTFSISFLFLAVKLYNSYIPENNRMWSSLRGWGTNWAKFWTSMFLNIFYLYWRVWVAITLAAICGHQKGWKMSMTLLCGGYLKSIAIASFI